MNKQVNSIVPILYYRVNQNVQTQSFAKFKIILCRGSGSVGVGEQGVEFKVVLSSLH